MISSWDKGVVGSFRVFFLLNVDKPMLLLKMEIIFSKVVSDNGTPSQGYFLVVAEYVVLCLCTSTVTSQLTSSAF